VTASANFEHSKARSQQIHLTGLGVASTRAGARTDRMKGGESNMMFANFFAFLQTRLQREDGQTMAEYGVVLGVITLAAAAAFLALGNRIDDVISAVITRLS
jgi:Flp pilus assembly pilin Flp